MADSIRRSRLLVIGNGPTAIAGDGAIHVERQLGELLLDLADGGHEVSFAQPMVPLEDLQTYYGFILPPGRLKVLQVSASARWRSLAKIMRTLRHAEFVYLFYPGTLPRLIARICQIVGKPYGLYVRGQQFSGASDARLLRGARFINTVSPALLAETSGLGGALTVIRPMLEISPADAVHKVHQPLAGRPVRLVFIGRLEPDKGVPELIEAAALLRIRGVTLRLSLIGGGPLHAQLAQRAEAEPELGLYVRGVVSDREQLMQAVESADVLVLPTHHEGFPRVLHEAMIKSTAIVTTMVGGIPALMRDGENCLAIPVGDPAAIANAIERLAENPSLRQRLTAAAMETVIDVLTRRPTHLDALIKGLGKASGRVC